MSKFYITIGSVPHREKLVADIFFENKHFAQVSHDEGEMMIEFYSNREGGFWEFSLDEALQAIQSAKNRLRGNES